jgi:hypothetical protein
MRGVKQREAEDDVNVAEAIKHESYFLQTLRDTGRLVGITTARTAGVRLQEGALQSVQIGSGAHSASYPIDTVGYFLRGDSPWTSS